MSRGVLQRKVLYRCCCCCYAKIQPLNCHSNQPTGSAICWGLVENTRCSSWWFKRLKIGPLETLGLGRMKIKWVIDLKACLKH